MEGRKRDMAWEGRFAAYPYLGYYDFLATEKH